ADRNAVGAYLGNPNAHNLGAMVNGKVLLQALGTTNLFSASTVDQMPKQVSAGLMFGTALTVPVPDLDRTDYLLILRAHPFPAPTRTASGRSRTPPAGRAAPGPGAGASPPRTRAGRRPPRRPTSTSSSGPAPTPTSCSASCTRSSPRTSCTSTGPRTMSSGSR